MDELPVTPPQAKPPPRKRGRIVQPPPLPAEPEDGEPAPQEPPPPAPHALLTIVRDIRLATPFVDGLFFGFGFWLAPILLGVIVGLLMGVVFALMAMLGIAAATSSAAGH